MAGEWRDSIWGEEISLEYGKALRGYNTERGAYRVFGSNGAIGWTVEPLAPGPGVILGRKGAYRGVEYSRDPFWVIDTAYYVVPKTKLDHRWLYYAIKHHQLGEIDDGSPIPSTTRAAVYVKDVRVPPLKEQRAIACILGALDDKIELNRQRNRMLESMARAIFQSWFVDFDPVKAKASGGQPPGLKPGLGALFTDRFEESPLGPIPAGWRAGTLNDVIAVYDSKRIPLSNRQREQRRGPYPYYGAAAHMDSVDDYLFDGVYVLMGEDGSVVKDDGTPVLQYVWGKFWVNNHAHVLQGTGSVSTEHLLLHLKTCNIIPFVTGAVQPKLNQGNMNRIGFTHAPEPVNRKFGELIAPLFARSRQVSDESHTLAALRDALLPKLISGVVRVPDAERIVGRAT